MSDKVSWEDIKNGKPLPPSEAQGSNGTGVKAEQRGITYTQFSAEKARKAPKNEDNN